MAVRLGNVLWWMGLSLGGVVWTALLALAHSAGPIDEAVFWQREMQHLRALVTHR